MITDLDPFSLSSFTVKPLTPLSDHSQITLFIKRTETNTTPSQPSNLTNITRTFRWAPNSEQEFEKAVVHPQIQAQLDSFLDTPHAHSNEGIDNAVAKINQIFMTTAHESQLKKSSHKPQKQNENNWFDRECQEKRKLLRK